MKWFCFLVTCLLSCVVSRASQVPASLKNVREPLLAGAHSDVYGSAEDVWSQLGYDDPEVRELAQKCLAVASYVASNPNCYHKQVRAFNSSLSDAFVNELSEHMYNDRVKTAVEQVIGDTFKDEQGRAVFVDDIVRQAKSETIKRVKPCPEFEVPLSDYAKTWIHYFAAVKRLEQQGATKQELVGYATREYDRIVQRPPYLRYCPKPENRQQWFQAYQSYRQAEKSSESACKPASHKKNNSYGWCVIQ